MARFRVSGKALAVVLIVFLAVAAVWIRSVRLSSHEMGTYAWRPERSPFPSKVFGFLNRESAGRGIDGESRIAQNEVSTKIARQSLDADRYGTTPNYGGGDYRAHRARSQAIPIGTV